MKSLYNRFQFAGREFIRLTLRRRGKKDTVCTIPARIANRYTVISQIAHGGSGVILEIFDDRMAHHLVAKTVLDYQLERYTSSNKTTDALTRIQRLRHHLQTERRILVQLNHRGTNSIPVPCNYVYDCNPRFDEWLEAQDKISWKLDKTDLLRSEPFLIMQKIDGISLSKLINTYYRQGMSLRKTLDILIQITSVLEVLEQPFTIENRIWELVYQDLKPSNIVIGDSGRARLIDFGGCQLLLDGIRILSGSHTPGYCPPEQQTRAPLDRRADVYGIGSTMYHMLTGISPRKLLSSPYSRTVHKHRSSHKRRAVQMWNWKLIEQQFPSSVKKLLKCCLSPQREDRFPDAHTLTQELIWLKTHHV